METKLENWSSSFLLWTSSSPFEKKSTSSYKQHHSLPLLAPKTMNKNQTQNPKQIPIVALIFQIFSLVFFFFPLACTIWASVCNFLFSFFIYPLFLIESGFVPCWIWAIICVCIWALKDLSTCQNRTHLQKNLSSSSPCSPDV